MSNKALLSDKFSLCSKIAAERGARAHGHHVTQ